MLSLLVPILAATTLVSAHGQVSSVSSGGTTIKGPNIYYDGDRVNSQTAVRTMYKASSPAFVLASDFNNNAKMACEEAPGAPATLKVKAGDSVTVQWVGSTGELLNKAGTGGTSENPWVHAMGPVIDYIASCNGDCSSFDATYASWVKIAEFGIDNSQSISSDLRTAMANKPEPYYPKGQGLWGLAKLIQDGSKWNINVPSVLKNGQYIIRHELAAVHSNRVSGNSNSGPQNYISCIQIEVSNGGNTDLPEGTLAGSLYRTDGNFANFNVYASDNAAQSFTVPGPAVWDQVSSGSSNSGSSNSGSSTSGSSNSGSSNSGSSNSGSSNTGSSNSGSGSNSATEDATPEAASEAAPSATSSAPESTVSSVKSTSCRRRKRSVFTSPSRNHLRALKKRLAAESF